jgi:hypothetical protein
MERFDINKELKNLEGLSVRAKCSALDDLCCTLREAISDISNAKNEILEEYERSCRKKFIDEINSKIKADFDVRIPYVDNYGYQVSYDGIPTYINFSCIEGEWYIYFTILEGSLKPVKELVRKMGGDSESLELRASEENLVWKFLYALYSTDDYTRKEVIFKFGDQANTVNSENWKTIPLETMDSRTDWVVILTDDAEAYLNEINAIVAKMKHPKTCFVIDLHPCANYKHLQKLWDNYIMTDKESVGVLLNFIHHHLVNPSRITFFIQDFREYSVLYPLVRAGSTEIGKKVTIDSNAKAIYYGLCFELNCEFADSYMNTFNENLDEMGEDIGLQWSIQNSTDNVVEVLYLYKPKV